MGLPREFAFGGRERTAVMAELYLALGLFYLAQLASGDFSLALAISRPPLSFPDPFFIVNSKNFSEISISSHKDGTYNLSPNSPCLGNNRMSYNLI